MNTKQSIEQQDVNRVAFAEACKYGEPRWELVMDRMSAEEFARLRDDKEDE